MPTNKPYIKAILCGLPVVLLSAASLSANAGPTYSEYDKGKIPMNNYGECWEASGGLRPTPECGGMAPAAPKMVDGDDDGDGVPNSRDRCPNTHRGVAVDSSGCAKKDSDRDGVPDDRDRCPNTPPGAPVDRNGCALDSDGDGVPNHRDECPDTHRGAKVNASGCEIIQNITIKATSDHFDVDSAVLKPAMKSALDDVAGKIMASPGDERIQVTGHTDSTGSEAYNQDLSMRRANAAADYLSSKGVDANMISTMGMGESQPAADNSTKAGRAMNRRVEISAE